MTTGEKKKKIDVGWKQPSVAGQGDLLRHQNHDVAFWLGHSVLRGGRVFRLNSSPALLLQLPFVSLLSAPGIVARDTCGLSVDGACTMARRNRPSRGSDSSLWSSSTTTPTTTLLLTSFNERAPLVHERVNVRCSIPPTERGKLCRPAMRCTWVTCSLSALSPASSPKKESALNESALGFCATKPASAQHSGSGDAVPASERQTCDCIP